MNKILSESVKNALYIKKIVGKLMYNVFYFFILIYLLSHILWEVHEGSRIPIDTVSFFLLIFFLL